MPMSEAVLSVRGEARRTIAPDYLTLHCWLNAAAASKLDALAQVQAVQQRLVAMLTGLGGAVLTVDTQRGSLTWSVGSVSTNEEHDFDKTTGRHGATGRVVANAAVVVTLRDVALLPDLGEGLASVDQLHVAAVDWHVDSDNAAWRDVRADAIAAAIAKARDYATALGGGVVRVEHIADAGLLASRDEHFATRGSSPFHATASAAGSGGPTHTPSLDPVPQEIYAVVEARLIASVAALRPDDRITE